MRPWPRPPVRPSPPRACGSCSSSPKRALAVPDTFEVDLVRSGLAELPVTAAHARAMLTLTELAGHDPFDSLLVAQARAERMPFLTADRVLLGSGLGFLLDARR